MTFSLVALFESAFGGEYTNLNRSIQGSSNPATLTRAIQLSHIEDPRLLAFLEDFPKAKKAERDYLFQSTFSYIGLRAKSESLGDEAQVADQVKQIKRSPLYRDERVKSANWFGKAAEALGDMISDFFKKLFPANKTDSGKSLEMLGVLGKWAQVLMWVILSGFAGVFAYFVFRYARWKIRLQRKLKAVLEDDEPERTVDEWLARADELESLGNYREAVRCLYLACLLRFDEARIARFDRGQTNWEHLHRIEASPNLPAGLEFRPTTQAFDQIWYGMRTRGKPDVAMFRETYIFLTDIFARKAA